jgi:hypothetical protein
MSTCATTGEGVSEGLDWLIEKGGAKSLAIKEVKKD